MQPIEETIGFALAQTCKAHRALTEAALKPLHLHVGQEMILLRLWREEGQTQSQLGACLAVEPPTISKMLQRMEQEQLLERRPDRGDARITRVYLSERTRTLRDDVAAAWHSVEERAIAGLTTEERLLLRRLLLHVRNNLAG